MVGAHALTCVKEFSRVVNTKLGSRCSEEKCDVNLSRHAPGGTLTAIALGLRTCSNNSDMFSAYNYSDVRNKRLQSGYPGSTWVKVLTSFQCVVASLTQ